MAKSYLSILFFSLISKVSFACTLEEWKEKNKDSPLEIIKYNLPLPDQNNFHTSIKKRKKTNEKILPAGTNYFIYNRINRSLWFEQKKHTDCKKPYIIDHTKSSFFSEKIKSHYLLYKKTLNIKYPKLFLNAILIVDELEKIGSFNPEYGIIFIKKNKWNFITHKTFIHEINHALEIHEPAWFSEGLSEWLAIQYLSKIYPKKTSLFRRNIVKNKVNFYKTHLHSWEGKQKYEKSFFIVDQIMKWRSEKNPDLDLKNTSLQFLIKDLSSPQKKQVNLWIQE